MTGKKVGKVGKAFPTVFGQPLRINIGMLKCGHNGGMKRNLYFYIEISKR